MPRHNRPPKINPTGTTFTNVRVWATAAGYSEESFYPGTHSPAMKGMLKVMGEYMKADFVVEYSEEVDDFGVLRARMKCTPPLQHLMEAA